MGCNQSVPQKETTKVIEVKKVDETTKDETVSHKIAVIEEEACDSGVVRERDLVEQKGGERG